MRKTFVRGIDSRVRLVLLSGDLGAAVKPLGFLNPDPDVVPMELSNPMKESKGN